MIFILKNIHNEELRLDAESIESYEVQSHFTVITTKSGKEHSVLLTPELIDKALTESYIMVKNVL